MALTIPEIRNYTRKLYRFLGNGHRFEFRKMRVYRGLIEGDEHFREDATITLDHRQQVISTLIHEFLHYQHPDWCETDILKMESRLISSLSDRQIRNLIKRFADAL